MLKGLFIIVKITVMLAITLLAIIAALYVLDVFPASLSKEILTKLMSVIGIFAGASLLILITASINSGK